MDSIKRKIGILIGISGILVLFSILIPSFIIYYDDFAEGEIVWLFGVYIDISDGSIDEINLFDLQSNIIMGIIFFLILLIMAILLIILSYLTIKEREISYMGLILSLIGIFLILAPFLIQSAFAAMELVEDSGRTELFAYQYNSLILFLPIAGTLALIPQILKKKGEIRNG